MNSKVKVWFKIVVMTIIFSLVSCQTPKQVIVYKTNIPKFDCPKIEKIVWDEYSINKTEEENLLVEPNNIENVRLLIEKLVIIIQCYDKNIKKMREKK